MITIYTKDYCPYCTQAKNLLSTLELEFQEINITEDTTTMREIMAISHMRTVPQIFVEKECLGGYSDIAALHQEGKLVETIREIENENTK